MTAPLASTALAWLLTYAIHSTVLLGFAWVVTRRRRDPAIADVLWKAAILGGLVTATVQMQFDVRPVGSIDLPQTRAPQIVPPSTTVEQAPVTDGAEAPTAPVLRETGAPSIGAAPSTSTPSTGAPIPTDAAVRPSAATWIVGAWGVVALLLAIGYAARRLILVGRLVERQPLTDGPVPALLDTLRAEVGHRRRVALTTSRTISSPVALGTGEICLPDAAVTELGTELQRSMLAHELAHLARRDPIWLAAASLIERFFFFQPLNHLARREMQTAAEYLCDDWAARRTGSGIPLAKCLAKVAEWIQAAPLGVPVAGMAEHRSLLVSRISRLIDDGAGKSPTPRRGVAAVALLALIATVVIAPGVSGRMRSAVTEANSSGEKGDFCCRTGALDAKAAAKLAKLDRQHARDLDLSNVNRDLREAARAIRTADLGRVDIAWDGKSKAPADTTVVLALIERLKDDDAQVRRAAANSLGRLEDRRAVPGLIGALRDPVADVRAAAADALGDFEDPRAIGPLSALLTDANADVKQEALGALSNYEKGVPASAILPLLNDSDADVRHEAAHLLGRLRDRAAVPALIKLVRDQSKDVRLAAISSLSEIEDPSAATTLINALSDPVPDVRQEALQALDNLKVAIPDATLLTLMKDGSADVRSRAASIAGDRSLVNLIPMLKQLMADGSSDVRESAVDALGNMPDQSAREALRSALNSSDAKVRRRAAEALGERP